MEWLADPFWGGIGAIAAVIALMVPALRYALRRRRANADSGITQPKSDVHALAARFIELFRAHGIERTQITRFLGPESRITLADLSDDDRLISKLDDSLLENVCERFCIRREWLEGASNQIYPLHDFYKYPEKFSEFLDNLLTTNKDGNLWGRVLRAPQSSNFETDDVIILLEEVIGWIGEKPIHRLHICNNWAYRYWKSRAYLTACIAIAWKKGVFLSGRDVDKGWLASIYEGTRFIEYDPVLSGLRIPRGTRWYAEDLALHPELFLEHIDDPCEIKTGLEFWLDLDQQGLMSLGDKRVFQGARRRFEKRLAQLNKK